MDLLLSAVAFVCVVVVTVTIHELGHYLLARLTGIRAEAFQVGLGRPLLSRADRGGTRWSLAPIPLGGFVRFRGQSMPIGPRTVAPVSAGSFQAASLGARAATIVAGPGANLLLAALLFSLVPILDPPPARPFTVGTTVGSTAATETEELRSAVAFRPGDVLTRLDGEPIASPSEIQEAVASEPGSSIRLWTVQRGEDEVQLHAPNPFVPIVTGVAEGGPATAAGLRAGDLVAAADGRPLLNPAALGRLVREGGGSAVVLDVIGPDGQRTVQLTPRPEGGAWRIGLTLAPGVVPEVQVPALGEALVIGLSRMVATASATAMAMGSVFDVTAACGTSGPIEIARLAGSALDRGLGTFVAFTAAVSVILAVMNLLPIPVLDGGHLAFLAYEGVTGQPPTERAHALLLRLGVVVLFVLVSAALFNDVFC